MMRLSIESRALAAALSPGKALFLRKHPGVRRVYYPALDEQIVAGAQMPRGFGQLLSFEVAGDAAAADGVVELAQIVRPATSFGGIDSTWERRSRWPGETAPASLIRLSVGVKAVEDLLADIGRALVP